MKIGDRVYVHGHVDEIRKDCVIIRNEGGYFGTVKSEIVEAQKTEDIVSVIRCKDCKWYGRADTRRFYRGMDCLQKRIDTIVPDKDYCSRAERKPE
jgi:hypothetical protein